ncbi:hypothetical protein CRE_04555 [Caenorhabditis remanei]|uniref:Uncharacterized protein n=1 Tax=Caenorhabditis remanei TaxID=31234 RepID=E3LZ25_CAERE|nr:hypothetical protein CRE_04555 [Caenorhabditis remanei]
MLIKHAHRVIPRSFSYQHGHVVTCFCAIIIIDAIYKMGRKWRTKGKRAETGTCVPPGTLIYKVFRQLTTRKRNEAVRLRRVVKISGTYFQIETSGGGGQKNDSKFYFLLAYL